jgi:putative membrane protein
MVKDHEEAVVLFASEANDGKDPAVKAWAEKTLPTLREHLRMARELQGK